MNRSAVSDSMSADGFRQQAAGGRRPRTAGMAGTAMQRAQRHSKHSRHRTLTSGYAADTACAAGTAGAAHTAGTAGTAGAAHSPPDAQQLDHVSVLLICSCRACVEWVKHVVETAGFEGIRSCVMAWGSLDCKGTSNSPSTCSNTTHHHPQACALCGAGNTEPNSPPPYSALA